MTEEFIARAELALAKSDEKLGKLLSTQKLPPLIKRDNYFSSLCRSIMGQQVSVAAAGAIFARLEALTGLLPAAVAALSESDIKTIGLSKQKASYILDVANHFIKDPHVYNHLESQDDDAVIAELTAMKGIGVWTAQMFLIFTLARPDVFAPDDGGLQRAMKNLYGWESIPTKAELEKTAALWKPYRTVACLHLWHSLNNKPL